jgi:hypothetical protein
MGNVMHIDHDSLALNTESDVEQKVIMPLLSADSYLGIPQDRIRTKEYLAPTQLDKTAGKTAGYYPDYSVWFSGFPVLIVEAKAPGVACEEGYREASLYARHLNQNYPAGVNPCQGILASNGIDLVYGRWDAQPELSLKVADLRPGGRDLDILRQRCGIEALAAYSIDCLHVLRSTPAHLPFEIAGGQALLNSKLPVNSFAADLSPILRRYFSNQEDIREIAEHAYVNSAEATAYDRVLESLLKERLNLQRDTIVQPLAPGKRGEDKIAGAIAEFDKLRPLRGHLQIVQGRLAAESLCSCIGTKTSFSPLSIGRERGGRSLTSTQPRQIFRTPTVGCARPSLGSSSGKIPT